MDQFFKRLMMTKKSRTLTELGEIDRNKSCHPKKILAACDNNETPIKDLPETGTIGIVDQQILPLFNLRLLEEMQDEEYTKDILQNFLKQTPLELAKLSKAGAQKNYKEVAAIAHSLKSCTSLLQITGMFSFLELIEQTALRENENLPEMVVEVIGIYRTIEDVLFQHLQLMKA